MFLLLNLACAVKDEDTADPGGVSVVSLYAGLSGVTDAIPSPDGATLYFTVADAEGGLWTAPFDGSGSPARMATLTAPQSLVTDEAGDTVYATDGGGIFSVPAAGGDPAVVAGTEAHGPLGIDLRNADGADWLYYTGFVGKDAAVLRILAAGGKAEVLASGAPLSHPSGVVADEQGGVWVCDESAGSDGRGALLAVAGGEATVLTDTFEAGIPCGVVLTPDDATVMVSAVDETGHSEVLLVPGGGGEVSVFNDVIGANTGSGGLHRQEGMRLRSTPSATHYAWVSRSGGTGNQVYEVTFE
jgi:DNA-binding beta-propeller fold protein YncE